jgi:immune inhibitor A
MPRLKSQMVLFLLSVFLLSGAGTATASVDVHREPGWEATPPENLRFTVFDLPAAEIEERLAVPYAEMLERRSGLQVMAPSDTGVVLIMLCQWADNPADPVAHPKAAYDTLLFSLDVVDPGSMRDFWLEDSYGSYWIEGEVYGWFTQPTYDPDLWFTDFFEAADPYIDYSQYDRDGDGYTDAVWIFHAGPGQEETHDPDHIWSYAVWGLDYMTDDGVIIDRYACNPEEHSDGSIISIRIPAHEGTHVLGIPDLYDYDSKLNTVTYHTPNDANDHPLVDWCVMGYAGYNIMSYGTRQDPGHHCAWTKTQLGFVIPQVLGQSRHRIEIPEVETNPVVYKILRPSNPDEYFLLENRNTLSSVKFDHLDSDFSAYWSWFTPGQNQKDPGLLVLHVDDDMPDNDGRPSNAHYMVTVEDAGYDPATPWDGVSEFSNEWYPYEMRISAPFAAEDPGQASFTPNSVPSSTWYGQASGIWITNISESDSVMTFDLGFGNAWPAIVEHFPLPIDTTIAYGDSLLLSVIAVDEDGDQTTYVWHLNGGVVQSGPDSSYLYQGGAPGATDTILVVATDGQLADSLVWTLYNDAIAGVEDGVPSLKVPILVAAPTPFNPSIEVRCTLPQAGRVRLSVYDLSGRLLATLADEERDAGLFVRTWDGKNDSGVEAATGVYLVRLATRDHAASKKVTLMR